LPVLEFLLLTRGILDEVLVFLEDLQLSYQCNLPGPASQDDSRRVIVVVATYSAHHTEDVGEPLLKLTTQTSCRRTENHTQWTANKKMI
jgi:hypothetical protein